MKKQILLAAAAGAAAAVLGLAALAAGWGDTQIDIGKSTIGDKGSLINGVGITNGAIFSQAANLKAPAGDTTLAGNEDFVLMAANHSCTLGSATTNTGHRVTISNGGNGTNAILTVSAQTIAGAAQWTNTAQYSITTLISDGSNWQLAGARGN